MKNFTVFLLFIVSGLKVSAQNKDAIVGTWLTPKHDARIEIYKRGEAYFGKLVWFKEQTDAAGKPKTDIKNPDAALRNRPLLNLEFLKNFVYAGDNNWTNGEIYDAQSGKTYSSKISMTGNNQLNLRGYVGVSLFGRTEIWTRAR
ncbi:MAG: DUF2147 domain-containing protein [Sphingobacteriaceae bacterium]|nr:MAG: DUF2147 domain-containing protein [Sphingobacteriaceae bacterium]